MKANGRRRRRRRRKGKRGRSASVHVKEGGVSPPYSTFVSAIVDADPRWLCVVF